MSPPEANEAPPEATLQTVLARITQLENAQAESEKQVQDLIQTNTYLHGRVQLHTDAILTYEAILQGHREAIHKHGALIQDSDDILEGLNDMVHRHTTEIARLDTTAARNLRHSTTIALQPVNHQRVSVPQPLAARFPVISQLPAFDAMSVADSIWSEEAANLFALPEVRTLVLRPPQLLKAIPLNFYGGKRKLNLKAVYGQIRGVAQDIPCNHCRHDRPRGPFAICVKVSDILARGSCMNCAYGGHGNDCSLNLTYREAAKKSLDVADGENEDGGAGAGDSTGAAHY
ncbi:hypothetical protein PVAG01_01359 [Phlyctema vagabunda]|uniref:Uncharacterized protein n=1 Tax=Phlyctema vagabunda TaxID=108571 RepID=A0ABR4PXA2_9HELO